MSSFEYRRLLISTQLNFADFALTLLSVMWFFRLNDSWL